MTSPPSAASHDNAPPSRVQPPAPASPLPWNPVTALVLVVGIYFLSQVAGQLAVGLYPLLRGYSHRYADSWLAHSTWAQFFYVAIVEALTMGMLYWFMKRRGVSLSRLGLVRPKWLDIGMAFMTLWVYIIVLRIAETALTYLLPALNENQRQQIGFQDVHGWLYLTLTFMSLVVLPPIVEETIMRGFLFGSLKKSMPVVWAAVATSVIFATAHLQIGSGAPLLWIAAVDTFILSLFLCYLRQKTGSLWPGILLHGMKNLLAFYVLFVLRLH